MQENSKQTYFASANSAQGFVSYFERCFTHPRIRRLYMIKGGPGTGKSRFIGDVAYTAILRGWHAEYYACSSDPGSLDGVILTHPGGDCIDFADATAPHVLEPTLPGVRDVLVNLGDFWNRETLVKNAGKIRTLGSYKQQYYDRGYEYLHAAGGLYGVRDSLITPCLDQAYLLHCVQKLSRLLPKGSAFEERIGLCDSIGMRGRGHLDTYERCADRLVILSSFYGTELRLINQLYEAAKEKGCMVRRAPHVLLPHLTSTLYFPQNRLCITTNDVQSLPGQEVRRIELRRACHADALRGVRGEARLAEKMANSAIDAACDSFSRAGEYHFELESLYTAAMDFGAKERFTATFCEAILQNP